MQQNALSQEQSSEKAVTGDVTDPAAVTPPAGTEASEMK
jgi:hypothetical protein